MANLTPSGGRLDRIAACRDDRRPLGNEGFYVQVWLGAMRQLLWGQPFTIRHARDADTLGEAARILAGTVQQPAVPAEVVERIWRDWPHLRHAVEAVVRNA